MKFKVDKTKIEKALNIASKATPRNTTLEILNGILIVAMKGSLVVTGSNLTERISILIEGVDIEEEGQVVLESKMLVNIISKMPNGLISFKEEKDAMSIELDAINFSIMTMDHENFPKKPEKVKDNEKIIELKPEMFKNMVDSTIFATSADESRPILRGLSMQLEGSKLEIVGLDGYRMALNAKEIEDVKNNFKVVVPSDALKNVISSLKEASQLKVIITDKHITFNLGNIKISSRLLEGDYVNYNQILPTEFKNKLEVPVFEFKNSIERAALLASIEKKGSIKLIFEGNMVKFISESQTGHSEESIQLKDKVKDKIMIGFNPNYLLDAVKNIKSDKMILNMNTSISPIIIQDKNNANYRNMVLPVRLSS